MAHIDKFIEMTFAQRGHLLIVQPDHRVFLVSGGAQRFLSESPLNVEQVVGLLYEILPPERQTEAALQQNLRFPYASPSGLAEIVVKWQSGLPRVEVMPDLSEATAASPANGRPRESAKARFLPLGAAPRDAGPAGRPSPPAPPGAPPLLVPPGAPSPVAPAGAPSPAGFPSVPAARGAAAPGPAPGAAPRGGAPRSAPPEGVAADAPQPLLSVPLGGSIDSPRRSASATPALLPPAGPANAAGPMGTPGLAVATASAVAGGRGSAPGPTGAVAPSPDAGPTGAAAPAGAIGPSAAPRTAAIGPTNAASPAIAASQVGSGNGKQGIDALFHQMVRENCSDLHITTGNPPVFRKDGQLMHLAGTAPLCAADVRQLLFEITPDEKRTEYEKARDTDFSYEIPEVARFRCNLFEDRSGMGGVFRHIPYGVPTAKDLGLTQSILNLCRLTKGMVIVTGPTGSGKSSTLAAMIDHINSRSSAHIISIEDPIEFVHTNRKSLINQREIGANTAGFKEALRAALREDPDIIMVGEMRDLETVSIALEIAETGHLVLGTLHTNTAASAVDRIIDQFPSDQQNQIRVMLSSVLSGVIAQTLCRKKGGGRVAAREVLIVNPAISNLIREAKTYQIPSVMQTSKSAGMLTLSESLLDLVKRGLTSPEEAYSKAIAPSEFESLLQRSGIRLSRT